MPESAAPATGGASQQLKSIQLLRAVAALGVLTLHAATEKVAYLGGEPGPFKNFLLGAAGVDLFFVISGFVMVYSSESLFGRADAPRKFLLRRLARIAPLYWAVTIAIIAYIYAVHGAKLWEIYSPASLAASFLFYPYPRLDGLAFPVHLLGWTLNYEMFFYAVFAVAILLPRRLAVPVVTAVFVALVLLGRSVTLPLPFAFWANSIIWEFCLGMLIAYAYREGVRLPPAAAWALGIAACLGLAAMHNPPQAWGEWRVFFWGLPSAALVASCALSESTWRPRPAGRFFGLLGDASYSLYLVHPLTFPLVRWTVGRGIDFSSVPWVYAGIAFLAAIAASIACYWVFERPITRALQRRLREAQKSPAR
ncbi:MAG: exopolysaccharide production protein ExoZ [Hyphomicrobiales bacterium]|nr:exopolysaccharide production protein ExoZ [Hyphomicrobiales bacterium]